MVSLTVENYVKAIHQLEAAQHGPAATGQIAAALSVSPGTVSSMLKTLSESGLATYAPYEGAKLTPAGVALALRVIRRHRLIELFLSRTLAMSWDEVHEEAENMEHAVSDLLIDRIDAFLGNPEVDPHGDPIPQADGAIAMREARPLSQCAPGAAVRVARVVDQSAEFLRFLTGRGIAIGAHGQIASANAEAGVLTLRVGELETSFSREAASRILVEVE